MANSKAKALQISLGTGNGKTLSRKVREILAQVEANALEDARQAGVKPTPSK